MVSQRLQGVRNTVTFFQLLLVSIAYWLWVLAWEYLVRPSLAEAQHYLFYNEVLVIGLLLAVGSRVGHSGGQGQGYRESVRSARLQTVAAMFLVFGVMIALHDQTISGAAMLGFAPVLYLVLRWTNARLPRLVAQVLFEGRPAENVLIVGGADQAQSLRPWLEEKQALGFRMVGIATKGDDGCLADSGAPGSSAGFGRGLVAATRAKSGVAPATWAPGCNGGSQDRGLPLAVSTALAPATHAGSPLDAPAPLSHNASTPRTATGTAYPVLGTVQDLPELLRTRDIHQLLVMGIGWPTGFLRSCVAICEREGVRLFVVSDLHQEFRHTVRMFEDESVQLIGLREEPLENPLNRISKRILDLLIAVPAILLVLPPAILAAWALQRHQAPGPLFFRQHRTGFRKRQFVMYKFRTMRVENDDETRQVRRDDPRVFPGGTWMRRLSLDELPQFINVLRGEMSVVGPRPHMPAHDTVFIQAMNNYKVRSAVKPGLTGLAQVRGYRGGTNTQEDVAKRVASDIEYIERWTLGLDLWIIARTFWQIIFPPRTAY